MKNHMLKNLKLRLFAFRFGLVIYCMYVCMYVLFIYVYCMYCMWTIGVGLRMSTLDSNVAGSIPASICFLLEQETLSALLQSTQL